MRAIYILVPSMHPTGPIKGAIALANALADSRDVTLVSLKRGPGAHATVDSRVRQICLATRGLLPQRIGAYRKMLLEAGGRSRVASISLCLSADLANFLCRGAAVLCASVRGNLLENYRHHYGPLGVPLAVGHLVALRAFDHVVAMTDSMARQVTRYARRETVVIGNFVDEATLDRYRDQGPRSGPYRFVFLASLTVRKRPLVLVEAFAELLRSGVDAHLDMIGDGPLFDRVNELVRRKRLSGRITLHGHLSDPYPLLARADAFVLPSLSEGLSRAGLEALHLGVPCVLRDADGNNELIENGTNGMLFLEDNELPKVMLAAARLGREGRSRASLLPALCTQSRAARDYLELVERA